ncbi:MAG TPA: RNA 2',3'-cyclic phosphodiesterase [Abditibacterium sp.]|jgi:2'-5' RNA ligase
MTLRLFVALSIPDEVKTALTIAQNSLRESLSQADISWTRPENFHLTLRFLGDVEEARVAELSARLQVACAPFEPLELVCESLGCFPSQKPPRVLWAGLHGDGLLQLQKRVEAACAPFAERSKAENFAAHVTLARVRQLSHAQRQIAKRATQNPLSFGRWTATHVELIRSELGQGPARYSTLATFPLSGLDSAMDDGSR